MKATELAPTTPYSDVIALAVSTLSIRTLSLRQAL